VSENSKPNYSDSDGHDDALVAAVIAAAPRLTGTPCWLIRKPSTGADSGDWRKVSPWGTATPGKDLFLAHPSGFALELAPVPRKRHGQDRDLTNSNWLPAIVFAEAGCTPAQVRTELVNRAQLKENPFTQAAVGVITGAFFLLAAPVFGVMFVLRLRLSRLPQWLTLLTRDRAAAKRNPPWRTYGQGDDPEVPVGFLLMPVAAVIAAPISGVLLGAGLLVRTVRRLKHRIQFRHNCWDDRAPVAPHNLPT
jgi:hypothetical protein